MTQVLNYDLQQKLLALMENRSIAQDLYAHTNDKLEKIKEKLNNVSPSDYNLLRSYKAEIFKIYRNYLNAMTEITQNDLSQTK